MNKKYTYRWTNREDLGVPDNNYEATADYIICESGYTFGDYLADRNIPYEKDGDVYYVLDESDNRTGEAYWIIDIEDTDEDLYC